MTHIVFRWIGLLLVGLGLQGASLAQSESSSPAPAAAGLVKRLLGTVVVDRAGQRQPAVPGMVLRVGDTLRTGPASAAGITLADDTLLTAGADSELVITQYAFDPTTQDGNLLASLWRGTLHVVTGLIGKKAPEQVKIQTRTVVLGARGTEFIVEATPALAIQ